ncbi:hypothetical protein IKP13_08075 [bacterium]|nr:hypothetical protein [bacterium]
MISPWIGKAKQLIYKDCFLVLQRSNSTFAHKSGPDYYWANPSVDKPINDWYLVLYDQFKKKLRLFFIPAYSLTGFEERLDQPEKLNVKIQYDDYSYTDKVSGNSFHPYLMREWSVDLG